MKCAYCGKEAKGTREHIISSGVLGLFPECFATIDGERSKVYISDPMVKDVCDDCNKHKLSYIDSYAKDIIKRYFIRKYEKDKELDFIYKYTLMQKVCLKYAFNDLRSRKKDCSFFDRGILDYLLNEQESQPLINITLLAGLAVNTSPAPDFIFGNNKLRWGDSPVFLSNSIVKYIDYNTGKIFLRDDNKPEEFEKCALTYVFRFNSLQLLLMCWEKDIPDELLKQNNIILECQYPYSLLNSEGKSVLSRCTSEVTYQFENIIDVKWGQGIVDEISYMRGTFSDKSQQCLNDMEKKWLQEEQKLADEHPRK